MYLVVIYMYVNYMSILIVDKLTFKASFFIIITFIGLHVFVTFEKKIIFTEKSYFSINCLILSAAIDKCNECLIRQKRPFCKT